MNVNEMPLVIQKLAVEIIEDTCMACGKKLTATNKGVIALYMPNATNPYGLKPNAGIAYYLCKICATKSLTKKENVNSIETNIAKAKRIVIPQNSN